MSSSLKRVLVPFNVITEIRLEYDNTRVRQMQNTVQASITELDLWTQENRKEKLIELCNGFGKHLAKAQGSCTEKIRELHEHLGTKLLATKPKYGVAAELGQNSGQRIETIRFSHISRYDLQ